MNSSRPLRPLVTVPTCQVVSDPQLMSESPLSAQLWRQLGDLQAEFVRFVPWAPYPSSGCPELTPPANGTCFWEPARMDNLLLQFMQATAQAQHVVFNPSIVPRYFFIDHDTSPLPASPFLMTHPHKSYEGGRQPRDPTYAEIGEYFQRVFSYYSLGAFTDACGAKHTSPHRLRFSGWEVLNELEHGFDAESYTRVYDAITSRIRSAVAAAPPQLHASLPAFVGLGGVGSIPFIQYFLNSSNHQPGYVPASMISVHGYCHAARTPTAGYEAFFAEIDAFLNNTLAPVLALRDAQYPGLRVAVNEFGTELAGDIDTAPAPSPLWDRYFQASVSANYAYAYCRAAQMGLDVLGMSQYNGHAAGLRFLNLTLPWNYYPSIAMYNWTSGVGFPRYWMVKLLVRELGADPSKTNTRLLATSVSQDSPPGPPASYFCGTTTGGKRAEAGDTLVLKCDEGGAVMDRIDFASYGTSAGVCGRYQTSDCHAASSLAVVKAACLNRSSCSVAAFPGTFGGDPCVGTNKWLAVQAACNKGGGSASGGGGGGGGVADVFAQAFGREDGSVVLVVVNKRAQAVEAEVELDFGRDRAVVYRVNDETDGDPVGEPYSSGPLQLEPFEVVVLVK